MAGDLRFYRAEFDVPARLQAKVGELGYCTLAGFGIMAGDRTPEDFGSWPILLNTVGTYGVASASWHWARVGSLFQRISLYVTAIAYLFRYADDFLALAVCGG